MYPEVIFSVLGAPVNLYFLCQVTAVVVGFLAAVWAGQVRSFSRGASLATFLAGAVGAFFGGRVVGGLDAAALAPLADGIPWKALLTSGQASFGALGGGLVGALLFLRWCPEVRGRRADALDCLSVPIALTHAVARLGCLAAGCCHGKPAWDLPWAVVYSRLDAAAIYKGIPVHPSQLYDVGANLAIAALSAVLFRRNILRGGLLGLHVALYGTCRFFIEETRGDLRPMMGAWSIYQVGALLFVAGGLLGLWWGRRMAAHPTPLLDA